MRNFINKFSTKDQIRKLQNIFAASEIERALERKERLAKNWKREKPKVADRLDTEIESCFTAYSSPSEMMNPV